MYKLYDPLTADELASLQKLADTVKFNPATGVQRRRGANAPKINSIYNTSKWFDWTAINRAGYKNYFPKQVHEKIIQGWFLELPPKVGFLDVMNYWVDKPSSGTIIATALKDQTITLDGKAVAVSKGNQIGFHLSTLHELKASKSGQLWACVMYLGDFAAMSDE